MNDVLIITDENIYPKICRQDIFDECRRYIFGYGYDKCSFLDLRKLYKIKLIVRFVLHVGAYYPICSESQIIVFGKYVSVMNDMETKILDEIHSKYFQNVEFVVG